MLPRRTLIALAIALPLLTACATGPGTSALQDAPPIIFVPGNGDNAALWQTTAWRFESNGWPRERLFALDLAYPLARDDDGKAQPGRSSTAEHMAALKALVEDVLKRSGASKVVLLGNSRGGNAIRNYIQNGGGDKTVSHAVLGGTPNHGVWAIKAFREGNEFSGTGPFLSGLNAPKNAAGDEVTGPVKWLTIRSDNNDKYAQADGVWIGARGTATNVTTAGPELKGATNVVINRIDHRETSYSPAAFAATWRFVTGKEPGRLAVASEAEPVLNGLLVGLGVNPADAASGNTVNNLPLVGATLEVFPTDGQNGNRLGAAVHRKVIGTDGVWGPFKASATQTYEFVISANGYATTHIYRSALPRSSSVMHLRPERVADTDKDAQALVLFTRPRGYFDAQRDTMSLDGITPPPGLPPAFAGLSTSKLKLAQDSARSVKASFNGEQITGRTWPLAQGHVTVLELTY